MIKCNLNVILAERDIKVTELSEKTGISRVTLNQLRYNSGKGVQFETLNTLCEYLGITPGELFTYYRFVVKLIDSEKSPKAEEANFRFLTLIFNIDGDEFDGRIACQWDEDKNVFVAFVWNKLLNRISKIPQRYLLSTFVECFESAIGELLPIEFEKQITIYESESDEWLDNYDFGEN